MTTHDRRALGGLRFVSATSRQIVRSPLIVRVPGVELVRNRSGLFGILGARGLESLSQSFATQPAAIEQVFEGMVEDPAGVFLPRRFQLRLPRNPDPAADGDVNWLFAPIDVALFLAPAAPLLKTWAGLRARVVTLVEGTMRPLGGALITARPQIAEGGVWEGLSQPLHDTRLPARDHPTVGEVLVVLPALPWVAWSAAEDEVSLEDLDVRLEVRFDGAAGRLSDPDLLRDQPALVVQPPTIRTRAGRIVAVGELQVTLPP